MDNFETHYKCEHCEFYFASHAAYVLHKQNVHSSLVLSNSNSHSYSIKCEHCSLEFTASGAYDIHKQKVHNNDLALSYLVTKLDETCKKKYLSRTKSTCDIKDMLCKFDYFETTVYICPTCSLEFGLETGCITHVQTHCNKNVTLNGQTNYIEQSIPLFRCKNCRYKCNSKESCSMHVCNFAFPTYKKMTMDTCVYVCLHCHSDFSSFHQLMHHTSEEYHAYLVILTMYKCRQCCALFNLSHLMKTHKCTHKVTHQYVTEPMKHEISIYLSQSNIQSPQKFKDFRTSSLQCALRTKRCNHEIGYLNSYTCSLCSCNFQSYALVMDHLKQKHDITYQLFQYITSSKKASPINFKFYCASCKIPFINCDVFTCHVESEHCMNVFALPKGSTTFGCFQCEGMFPSLALLMVHMQRCELQEYVVTPIRDHALTVQGKSITVRVKETQSKRESKIYKCLTCPTIFLSSTLLLKHEEECNKKDSIQKKTSSISKNKKRSRIGQNILKRSQTNLNKNLVQYIADIDTDNMANKCILCLLTFPSLAMLLEHILTCKGSPSNTVQREGIFDCLALIEKHTKLQNKGERTYKCIYCPNLSHTLVSLLKHIQDCIEKNVPKNWTEIMNTSQQQAEINTPNLEILHKHLLQHNRNAIHVQNIGQAQEHTIPKCIEEAKPSNTHTENSREQETDCEYTCFKESIKMNTKEKKLKTYKCNTCSEATYFSAQESFSHSRQCATQSKVKNDMITQNSRNKHEMLSDENTPNNSSMIKKQCRYSCHLCNQSFDSPSLLLAHKQEKWTSVAYSVVHCKIFLCRVCNSPIPNQAKLQCPCRKVEKNVPTQLKESTSTFIKCNLCLSVDMLFYNKDSLRHHLMVVHRLVLGSGFTACSYYSPSIQGTNNDNELKNIVKSNTNSSMIPAISIEIKSEIITETLTSDTNIVEESTIDINSINQKTIDSAMLATVSETQPVIPINIDSSSMEPIYMIDMNSPDLKAFYINCENANIKEKQDIKPKIIHTTSKLEVNMNSMHCAIKTPVLVSRSFNTLKLIGIDYQNINSEMEESSDGTRDINLDLTNQIEIDAAKIIKQEAIDVEELNYEEMWIDDIKAEPEINFENVNVNAEVSNESELTNQTEVDPLVDKKLQMQPVVVLHRICAG